MKKVQNKFIGLILIALVGIFIAGCGASETGSAPNSDSEKTEVTDFQGNKIAVPKKIEKVATAWDDFNASVLVCGAGKKIVATGNIPGAAPMLYKVDQQMNNALVTFGNNFNIEDLLKNKPDVIFINSTSKNLTKLEDSGIPVVTVQVTNFDELKKSMLITGNALGDDALQRAKAYNKYFDEKINQIKSATSDIPPEERPKVLHLQGTINPVVCDGVQSTIDDWITTAGGVNAAQDVVGTVKEISMEQVNKWNPDIIILGTSGDNGIHTAVEDIYNDPKWQNINAVKNHRVYVNPNGCYMWDRNTPEEALQIQWAAKIFWPDKFKDIDIIKETQSFYKQFFDYDLSTEDAQKIINASPIS